MCTCLCLLQMYCEMHSIKQRDACWMTHSIEPFRNDETNAVRVLGIWVHWKLVEKKKAKINVNRDLLHLHIKLCNLVASSSTYTISTCTYLSRPTAAQIDHCTLLHLLNMCFRIKYLVVDHLIKWNWNTSWASHIAARTHKRATTITNLLHAIEASKTVKIMESNCLQNNTPLTSRQKATLLNTEQGSEIHSNAENHDGWPLDYGFDWDHCNECGFIVVFAIASIISVIAKRTINSIQ